MKGMEHDVALLSRDLQRVKMCIGNMKKAFAFLTAMTLLAVAGCNSPSPAPPATTPTGNATALPLTPINGGTAKVEDAFGDAQETPDGSSWRNINVGDTLAAQTKIRTGDSAAVLLRMAGNHVLRVGADTTIGLQELGKDKSFSFTLLAGQIWSLVEHSAQPAKYEIETPSAVVGVTGTLFSVLATPDKQTMVSTDEGVVTVKQDNRIVRVTKGYFVRLQPHQKEEIAVVVQPQAARDAWQQRRATEGWMQHSGVMRLNRQFTDERSRPGGGFSMNPGLVRAGAMGVPLAGGAIMARRLGQPPRGNFFAPANRPGFGRPPGSFARPPGSFARPTGPQKRPTGSFARPVGHQAQPRHDTAPHREPARATHSVAAPRARAHPQPASPQQRKPRQAALSSPAAIKAPRIRRAFAQPAAATGSGGMAKGRFAVRTQALRARNQPMRVRRPNSKPTY